MKTMDMTFFQFWQFPLRLVQFPSMTKRPFQKKHLIQVFVGGGSLALMNAGIDSDFSWWPGLILVGLGGIIAIAEPRRQTVADWIVRWTGRLPKMSISLFLVGGGVGLLIITFVYPVGGDLICLGLTLVGLGGVFAIGELARAALSRKSHSDKPEAEKARSSWGSWVALLIFGLIAYIIWSFLNWLPGPI